MESLVACKVEGMTCGNCALTVTKYLEKQGMTDVAANAATGEVTFNNTIQADVTRIYKGINGLGYRVLDDAADDESAGHHHSDKQLVRLLAICALFTVPLLLHMFLPHQNILNHPLLQLLLCLPVYVIGVYKFGVSAFRSLKNGIPNMDVLIIIGASAAFFYSIAGVLLYQQQAHQYLFFETAATIITFVLLGNWVEAKTVTSTTTAIKELASLQPTKALIVMTDSIGKESIMEVEGKYLKLNDIVLVNEGDNIPVDGIVIKGEAAVDESMLTGESLPVDKNIDSTVIGGSVVAKGNIRVKATAIGAATALSEIIRMVQKAQVAKPPMQKLADKISSVFVPVVLGIAILSWLLNYFWADVGFAQSMMRSVAVLVIACPCAMGLATPAAVAVGLGRAARLGILIKGADTLERFKDIKQIVFDKTGTLTTGALGIRHFETNMIDETTFKQVVVSLEQLSSHPIAQSIVKAWRLQVPEILPLHQVEELKGVGMKGLDSEQNIWQLGSFRLLTEHIPNMHKFDLHLIRNGVWMGGIAIEDELRNDAAKTIQILQKSGYNIAMLSGDRKTKAEYVANAIGITEVYAEQTPAQKLEQLTALVQQSPTVMVGDGINDAPALTKADIGVSLSEASKVAVQSANVILSGSKLSHLPKALRLGALTYQTIKQNLFWAFFYNVLAIPLAAMGYLSPIWAALFMAFSDVVLVINSLRLNYRNID